MVRNVTLLLLVLLLPFLPVQGQNDTFTVVVNSGANLRSCASTTCEIVGRVAVGDVLTVTDVADDWYEVRTEEGDTAFIAGFLVTRGPDEIIEIGELHSDTETSCVVLVDYLRGSMDMYIVISGDRQDDVIVDLYRPNETRALPVEGQLLKEFIDTKDLYIQQYYSWRVGWPFGLYNVEYTIDDVTRRIGFEIEDRGEYRLDVMCE